MLVFALLVSCKSTEDPDLTDPSGSFVTYNAGLAVGFVPGANERQALVADAIASLDADVVCLQEVWLPGQVSAVQAAATDFPHQYFPDAQQTVDEAPACPDDALGALLECANTNCTNACIDELPGCVQGNCPFQFIGLPLDCLRCTMANVGGEIDEIAAACETQSTSYAYGGSFGTGLLSKHPILSTEEHVFESTTNRRSMIHSVIDFPEGPVDVYCTHLTAAFDSIPYPQTSGSWSEEQTAQIEELRDFIDATSTGPIVALGDFNTGPAGAGIVAEEPTNYVRLVDGYDVPYLELDGRCTFCGDNPLQLLSADDDESELIDHILVKGFAATPTYEVSRVLDEGVAHNTCGESVAGAYSDHYGVRVVINP